MPEINVNRSEQSKNGYVEQGDLVLIDNDYYIVSMSQEAEGSRKLVLVNLADGSVWDIKSFNEGINIEQLKDYLNGDDDLIAHSNCELIKEDDYKLTISI